MNYKQLNLLEDIYYAARGVLRYNGIDKEKTNKYFDTLDKTVEAYKYYLERGLDE